MIIRGTTQTHVIRIPFKSSDITALYVTYDQIKGGRIEKSLSDITFDDSLGLAKVHFSQNDTLSFKPYTTLNSDIVEIQVRVLLSNGKAYGTDKIKERIMDVLKEGVITPSTPTPTPPTPDVPDDEDNEIIYDGGGVSG